VTLNPDEWLYRNTLGAVLYRLGEYDKARTVLERSLVRSRREGAAFDLFFLAMCHQRLGDATTARAYYDRAVQWVEEHMAQKLLRPDWIDELNAFRSEARAVLENR
jgi:tetratricopeptide (TPR) repeat protein